MYTRLSTVVSPRESGETANRGERASAWPAARREGRNVRSVTTVSALLRAGKTQYTASAKRISGTRMNEIYKDFYGTHTVVRRNLRAIHMRIRTRPKVAGPGGVTIPSRWMPDVLATAAAPASAPRKMRARPQTVPPTPVHSAGGLSARAARASSEQRHGCEARARVRSRERTFRRVDEH